MSGKCNCLRCLRERDERVQIGDLSLPVEGTRMILCPRCGNKRCPHASDHAFTCTSSNKPGQPGSVYA